MNKYRFLIYIKIILMSTSFYNNDFNSILRINVINALYPQLIQNDANILLKYLSKLVYILSKIYNFDSDIGAFMYELTQNDYQDLKWLCGHLLPNLENIDKIKSFESMYTSKLKESDINKESPKYTHTNLQYGRCIRDTNVKEIEFSEEHLEHNFKLLVQSIIESSHKMYINWMDILPITIDNYSRTQLFRNSLDLFRNRKLEDINIHNLDFDNINSQDNISKLNKLHSLHISDVYNVIRNYLYEDIIPLKILIYDLVDIRGDMLIPAILFFKHFLESCMQEILMDNAWNSISQNNKDIFIQKINKLYEHSQKQIELPINVFLDNMDHSYVISELSIQRLVKALCITFDNTYRTSNQVIRSGYKPIRRKLDDEKDMDDEKVYDDYSTTELNIQIESIKPQFMYEHIRNLIQRIKFTVYGTFIFDNKKENIIESDMVDRNVDRKFRSIKQVSLKNIYNYAKSLSRYQSGKEYLAFPKHWKQLENTEKQEILNRLNGNFVNSQNWFNIKRYIRYILSSMGKSTDMISVDTYNLELYQFISEKLIIDLVFKSMIFKGILSELKPNKQLTDKSITPRSDRKTIVSKMNPNMFVMGPENPYAMAYSYLSELPYIYSGNIFEANKSAWFSLYALDWCSQIGFVHKYIHQRVSYMTGATGVGKSTQVPKLYMYYLKAIDYNSAGRVVCTQPRKAPTKNNADQVSKELGYPIFMNNKSTDYYYVQMQHKTQQHIALVPHLSLKYITDGTLVQEFKNSSPLLKRLQFDNTMANHNLYDVIIIDEAHEHGKNMDVLLTLMRDYVIFNPSIKLVILSATMDDDEPVYRRYYRDINDNCKFPIDCSIRDLQLDRVNIDRRYHISPVGLGTTYKIEETYLDGIQVVDIVKNLVREGLKGDILIFQPGEADIVKLVSELNENTPDYVIALPFYSALSDEKRSFIENIDENFSKLKISKHDSFAQVKSLTTGTSSYTNFIICATNIAEASITIKRLYYVIETGTRKTLIYSYIRRGGKLVTMNISESSRLQRKGRVGRTGPGHVYYTYKKGLMENNKILFEFSTGNISDSIFSFIQTKLGEKLFTIDELFKNKEIMEQFKNLFYTRNGMFEYMGKSTHYDYTYEKKYIPSLYETGYDSDILFDKSGMFYIVHPEELYIQRDIIGRIKGSIKDDVIYNNTKNQISSLKMNSFFEDLFMKKYLDMQNITNTEKYYKTGFGKLMAELVQTFSFEDPNLSEIMAYSLFFNTTDDICRITSMLASLNGDIMSLFYPVDESRMIYDLTSFKNLFSSYSSDFEILNDLGKEIIKYVLLDLDIDTINNNIKKTYNLNDTDFNNMIDKFENLETEEEGTKMKLKREMIFSARLNQILIHENLAKAIDNVCKIINISSDFVRNFLELYFVSSDTVKSLYYPNKRNKTYSEEIKQYSDKFNIILKEDSYNPIILTLMHAMPFNVAKRITYTQHFLSVYAPSSENIYGTNTYKQKKERGISYEPMTLIPKEYITNYVFYFSVNIQRESLICMGNIDKKYFKLFKRIYNHARLDKISHNDFKKIDKYLGKLEDKTIPKQITMNDIKSLQYVGATYKEILSEITE
jgi:hypothetical protein